MRKIKLLLVPCVLAVLWAAHALADQKTNVVDKFTLKMWNGSYYCAVTFPDKTNLELKSDKDLTFTGWQVKIAEAWKAHLEKPPEPKPELAAFTTDELKAELTKRGVVVSEAIK